MTRDRYTTLPFSLLVYCVISLALSGLASTSLADAVIRGTIHDAQSDSRLEGATIRILSSGFQTSSSPDGEFAIGYAPGDFTVVCERIGYMPAAISLSLATATSYPLGDIQLFPFPILVDMYRRPIENALLTIQPADAGRGEPVLSEVRTNADGRFLVPYESVPIRITASTPEHRPRSMMFDFTRPQPITQAEWILPPKHPGLYFGGEHLPAQPFAFAKKAMEGLAIPAYYDGRYSAIGNPHVVMQNDRFPLLWVPKHSVTLGENFFASPGGLFCFAVDQSGVFVRYDRGRSSGRKIPLELFPVLDEVDVAHSGFGQQKVQIFRVDATLPLGKSVLFQGGGNKMDKEPHPDAEMGCWYIEVTKDAASIASQTVCGTDDDNLKYGVYLHLFEPILDMDVALTYQSIQGIEDQDEYADGLLRIATGLMLLRSAYQAETALDVSGVALKAVGRALDLLGTSDYTDIIMTSLGEALRTIANPTPSTIAGYVVTNTFSIISNTLAAIRIEQKTEEMQAILSARDVLHAYFRNCGDLDATMADLDVEEVPADCLRDRLTCIAIQHVRNQHYNVREEHILEATSMILSGVNATAQELTTMEDE